MAGTQVRMDRSTITVEGANSYQIVTNCIVKGALTDTSIFLISINTPDDPKDDTLARIVEIADFDLYQTDRDQAIKDGVALYRSPVFTATYDDVETANNAQNEIKSRINTLVEDMDGYLEEFETPDEGEIVTYPTTDPSVKAQLEADYYASVDPIEDAEDAVDAKVVECSTMEYQLEVTEDRLAEAISDLEKATSINTDLSASIAVLNSVEGNTSIYNSNIIGYNAGSEDDSQEQIEVQTTLINTEMTTFSNENTSLTNLNSGAVTQCVNTLQLRVTTLTGDRSALQSDVNKCALELTELQAAVDAARATRNAALAAIRAVCPDFTPTS